MRGVALSFNDHAYGLIFRSTAPLIHEPTLAMESRGVTEGSRNIPLQSGPAQCVKY